MNHFLHLLILLPALFTTIIALPTSLDDTSNSWLDSPLDNPDTLLAATFGSPDGTLNSPLTSPGLPATTNEELPASPQTPNLPPVKPLEQDWTKPMYLCCRATSWWNDEEKECQISMEYIHWRYQASLLTPRVQARRPRMIPVRATRGIVLTDIA